MSFTLTLIVEYKHIFPELDESVEDLLFNLPKDILIKAGTTFLGKDLFKKENTDWKETLKFWFRTENKKFADDIASRIYNYYIKRGQNPSIFSSIANLKLLQLGLSKKEDTGESISELEIEVKMFKLYLLLNQIFAEKYGLSSAYISETYKGLDMPPMLALSTGFAISDLTNYVFVREFYCQSVKAFFLFCFLNTNPAFVELSKRLCEFYKITTLKDYYTALVPLIEPISKKKIDGFFEFNIQHDEQYEKNIEFISKLAIHNYNLDEDIDYKELRSQPFVQIEPDKYRVTHPIFFSDKIFKGLYFTLAALNKECEPSKMIKEFRSVYGREFSEKFLFYQVMNYSIDPSFIKFSGEFFVSHKIDGRPDFYVREKNNIYLFEYKEVLINANIKENGNMEQLENEFKLKFVRDGVKPKGITQILNNILFILKKQNSFDNGYDLNHLNVYPIIVVNDIMFDAAGFNYLLNKWFQEELNKVEKSEYPYFNIKSLLVLNFDTLILASDALRLKKIKLKEIFDVYYKTVAQLEKAFKNQSKAEEAIREAILPSSVIIESWIRSILPNSYPMKELLVYAFKLNGWD